MKTVILIVLLILLKPINCLKAQIITSIYAGNFGEYITSIAIDDNGNIYFGDYLLNCIKKLDIESNNISTVAGTGNWGYSGDGGDAASANLSGPTGLKFDSSGDLFFADKNNHVIRKIDFNTFIISTVAGNGTGAQTGPNESSPGSFSGDGGPAIEAGLDNPSDVEFDEQGNLYIADHNNFRVRKIDSKNGIITTIAGNGEHGFSGNDGPAIDAKLLGSLSIALDSVGNLYIGEDYAFNISHIRMVEKSTGIIKIIAGIGTRGYSGDGGLAINAEITQPKGLFVHKDGDLYFADANNNCIRKICLASGIINTVAGTGERGFDGDRGLATEAKLKEPADIFIDTSNSIFIVDRANDRIRVVYDCDNFDLTAGFKLTKDSILENEWIAYPDYPLIANNAKWDWGDGSSDMGFYPNHIYEEAGLYNICLVAYTDCGDSVTFCQQEFIDNSIIVKNNNPNNPVSSFISEIPNVDFFKFYPNPAENYLKIEAPPGTNIELLDLKGIIVMSYKINANNSNIDLSNIPQGIYLLKACSGKNTEIKRLVIL